MANARRRPRLETPDLAEEEVPMTRRSGAFAMAAASMLLVARFPPWRRTQAAAAAAASLPRGRLRGTGRSHRRGGLPFRQRVPVVDPRGHQAAAAAKGATVDIVDGQNSQPTQNEQIDLFISKGLPGDRRSTRSTASSPT